MLRYLCASRGWPLDRLETMFGFPEGVLDSIWNGSAVKWRGSLMIARMIWILYMSEVNPDMLRDTAFVIYWGRGTYPRGWKLSFTLSDYLAMAIELRKRWSEGILDSVESACEHWGLVRSQAIRLFKLAKLKPEENKIPFPGWRWWLTDWNNENSKIAARYQCSELLVAKVRLSMRQIGAETIVKVATNLRIPTHGLMPLIKSLPKRLRKPS